MENYYSYIFNDISDGWAKKVREVAPHGYISKNSWSCNSVDGIRPKVEFYNASKKTIKYITFYYTFKNAVGDPCYGLSGKKMILFNVWAILRKDVQEVGELVIRLIMLPMQTPEK